MAQTNFQKAVGIRYKKKAAGIYSDAKVSFMSFGRRGSPRSYSSLFTNYFSSGPLSRRLFRLRLGARKVLTGASGIALFSSPKLSRRSVSKVGAVYVGSLWCRKDVYI